MERTFLAFRPSAPLFVLAFVLAFVLILVLAGTAPVYAQSGTVTGTVVDASDGQPLIGANVTLQARDTEDVVAGTATDPDGTFALNDIPPGAYVLSARFVGYQEEVIPFTLEAGQSRTFNLSLALATSALETVVVSASRRQEKVLDAPASVSVLSPEDLEDGVATSTVEKLRLTPGVDMAQTGIDRREVTLRGFNNAFSSSTFVLTDYREAAVPSLGVNVHSVMPSLAIDVEQVEVVRGPGSALYGPGVDSGVIHYFTKDPFDYPGTTVSVSGGQRGFFGAQVRQAGVVGEHVGYKITGQFARADEWELDLANPADSLEIDRYRIYDDPNDPALNGRNFETRDFDEDGTPEARLRREDLYRKINVNGLVQYRLSDATTLSLNGGYSSLKSAVQSGIGTLQVDGFGYTYGQMRLQSGGLFAQAYVNVNDAGDDTYVYGTGNTVVDKGVQWNGQVQYDFAVPSLATQFITGADADITTPRTEGQILGRNEGDDQIREYGVYTQSTTDLGQTLSMTLAARGDYNNVVDEFRVSPRAALVLKPTPNNTIRGSFNLSFSSPGTNSNFLDIESQRVALPGGNALVFQALGAADGFTFNNADGTASSLLGANFEEPLPTSDVPLQPLFGTVVGGLRQAVESGDPLPAPLQNVPPGQLPVLLTQLETLATNPALAQTTTAGQLGIPNDSDRGFRPVDGPTAIDPLQQTTTQTFELGYKGLLGDRFVVQVDGYYEHKEDFIGPLRIESPLLYVDPGALNTRLTSTLTPLLEAAAEDDPTVEALLQQFGGADAAAATLASLTSAQIDTNPIGVVQPDQTVLPGGGAPNEVGGFLSYRNFGSVDYWGIDASLQYRASDVLDLFGNVSFVSDDFFDNEELDATDTDLSLALNAPSFKARGGFDVSLDRGFSFGATGNYVEGFPVRSGPYEGDVDSYFLLDLRAGYEVASIPGLRLDVSAKNVLNNEHRQFVGAPELGTTLLGRATYTLP